MKPKLVVAGSANRDLVVKTERIPAPGETVIGGAFVAAAGGKGGNQAVAAARLGAEVWFVGRVGQDAFGDALADEMEAAGIHIDFLSRDDAEPTGVALIGVDARGENAIIVAPGANHRLGRDDIVAALPAIAQAYAVIIQLEIPMEAVEAAIDMAAAAGTKVILNPAPVNQATPFPDSLLAKVDFLTPNEREAAQLLGYASPEGLDWETTAQRLRAKGIGAVVITVGEAGCVLADDIGTRRLPAFPVHAIDTTAAGDCFTGALATGLAEGLSLDDAACFACRAAALSVSRMGAQPSLPTRDEVDALPYPA
jgi:ribokinase